jgi:hypothetical protein
MAAPQGGEQRAAHFGLDLLHFVVLEEACPDGAANVVDQDVEAAEGSTARAMTAAQSRVAPGRR